MHSLHDVLRSHRCAGGTFRAQAAIQNILRLQKEHELDLSGEFHLMQINVDFMEGNGYVGLFA